MDLVISHGALRQGHAPGELATQTNREGFVSVPGHQHAHWHETSFKVHRKLGVSALVRVFAVGLPYRGGGEWKVLMINPMVPHQKT